MPSYVQSIRATYLTPEWDLLQQHVVLLTHPVYSDALQDRPVLRGVLLHQHRPYAQQSAKAWPALSTSRKAIPTSWTEVAVVLDADCGRVWDHKQYYERRCGPILPPRASAGSIERLLVSHTTYDYVHCLGERQKLGQLAGETDGG